MVFQGGLLKVVGHRNSLLPVQLNVLEEVLSVDEVEAKLGNDLIERIGQFSPHLSQKPIESSPNG